MASQLTDKKAKTINPGEKPVPDGMVPGLRLEPGTTKGRGRWIYASRRRVISETALTRGLGSYPLRSAAADARAKAIAARQAVTLGKDPIDEREATSGS